MTHYLAVESAKTIGNIKLPMETSTLQSAVNALIHYNDLWRRPESLLAWRRYQVGLLVLLAISTVSAYVMPDYLLGNVPLSTWSVVTLAILVLDDGVFLWICMELDRFIHKLNQENLHTTTVRRSMSSQHSK